MEKVWAVLTCQDPDFILKNVLVVPNANRNQVFVKKICKDNHVC